MLSMRTIQSIVFISTIFIMLISLSSCDSGGWQDAPSGRLSAGDWKLSIDQNGKARTFYLHIPACYKSGTAVPWS